MVGPRDLLGMAVELETLSLPHDPVAVARTYRAAAATIQFVEQSSADLAAEKAILEEDVVALKQQVATEQAQRLAAERKLILCKAAAKKAAHRMARLLQKPKE